MGSGREVKTFRDEGAKLLLLALVFRRLPPSVLILLCPVCCTSEWRDCSGDELDENEISVEDM